MSEKLSAIHQTRLIEWARTPPVLTYSSRDDELAFRNGIDLDQLSLPLCDISRNIEFWGGGNTVDGHPQKFPYLSAPVLVGLPQEGLWSAFRDAMMLAQDPNISYKDYFFTMRMDEAFRSGVSLFDSISTFDPNDPKYIILPGNLFFTDGLLAEARIPLPQIGCSVDTLPVALWRPPRYDEVRFDQYLYHTRGKRNRQSTIPIPMRDYHVDFQCSQIGQEKKLKTRGLIITQRV